MSMPQTAPPRKSRTAKRARASTGKNSRIDKEFKEAFHEHGEALRRLAKL